MELNQLKDVLDTVGIPVVYHSFQSSGQKVQQPPYIVYLYVNSDNFGADDKVYCKQNIVHVELYTKYKDMQLENKLEEAFDNSFIYYEKTELYIKEELMFEILYKTSP